MNRLALLALLLLLLSAAAPGPARAADDPPGTPGYRIGIDDQLQLSVRPRSDLSAQVAVLADGTISLPTIGAVKAEGLTVAQLSQLLTRRYSQFDRDITQVTVSVLAYNSQKIFVLGEVGKPGRYSFPGNPELWDAIREAGGPVAEADLGSVQVIRGEGETRQTMVVDLGAAISSGDFSGMPKLHPGDTVRLLKKEGPVSARDQIYVLGEVKTPGIYSTQAATDVMSAIMSAGGPSPSANLSNVVLTRRAGDTSKTLTLNMHDYLKGGKWNANLPLRPGDTVRVPQKGGSFIRGLFSSSGALPALQAVVSMVIAVESIRIARNR